MAGTAVFVGVAGCDGRVGAAGCAAAGWVAAAVGNSA